VRVDYIKSGAFGDFDRHFKTMRSLKPVLLHGLGYHENSGMEDIGIVDFDRANTIITGCGSPHYALHLAIRNVDLPPSQSDDAIYSRMYERIQCFKKNIPVPLLLENIADTPQEIALYDHFPFADPEKINKVVHDNGVNLLLDLTHAKITALYRDWDIYGYLRALPLNRVKEIHVNGSGHDLLGFPDDTHNAMEDADYALLDWVLTYANPEIITLEYIGIESETPDVVSGNLIKQLEYLNRIIRK
jgi:hypothetical protein